MPNIKGQRVRVNNKKHVSNMKDLMQDARTTLAISTQLENL